MARRLHIYDFDGTLCRTPCNTPENHKKFEEKTGIPWIVTKEMSRQLTLKHKRYIPMRKGWFGRPESLEPPLVPIPAPPELFVAETCCEFHKSKADPDTFVLILTGRHIGLRNQVLRIAADGGLISVKTGTNKNGDCLYNTDEKVVCLLLGDQGPKPKGRQPSETLPWKIWIVKQYVDLFDDLEIVEFWEDRSEHVEEFQKLEETLGISVVVHHVH